MDKDKIFLSIVFIYFSYDGTRYHGWQYQPNALSVHETLESALRLLLREQVSTVAAGRTDTGVHAAMMVAHADLPDNDMFSEHNPQIEEALCSLGFRLNGVLPQDIAVQRIVHVRNDAHARFDAISRTYQYHVITQKDPFLTNHATRLFHTPDFELMNQAATLLINETDFAAFCKAHSDNKTTICHLKQARWQQLSEQHWVFTIEADRFLRNMVRAVVGTLMEVGRHRMTIEQFQDTIHSHNRSNAGESMPAEGLFLTNITYPEDIFAH